MNDLLFSVPGISCGHCATAIREAYAARLNSMGHAATPQAGCTSHVSVIDRPLSRQSSVVPSSSSTA